MPGGMMKNSIATAGSAKTVRSEDTGAEYALIKAALISANGKRLTCGGNHVTLLRPISSHRWKREEPT